MNSDTRLRECFEYILSLEEKGLALYRDYLGRIQDAEIREGLEAVRGEEERHVQIARALLTLLKKYERAKNGDGSIFRYRKIEPSPFFTFGIYLGGAFLLALALPSGIGGLRFLIHFRPEISLWLVQESSLYGSFYLATALGSLIVLGVAAAWGATIHHRLKERERDLTAKARVLEDVAERDPLTDLYHFGYIRERLEIEMERAKRFQTPLSCLMLDVDNLKSINDGHGHLAGDAVLRCVAHRIQKEIRVIDTATRYGGDEFFLILPVTQQTGAHAVAERIRKGISEENIPFEKLTLKSKVSIGIAAFPAPYIGDVNSLVEAADQALYEAKRRGRDGVQDASSVLAVQKSRRMRMG